MTTIYRNPVDYCHIHGYEPIIGIPYIVCWECGHIYQTGDDLEAAYRQGYESSVSEYDPAYTTRLPASISFCPLCMHDF